MAGLGQGTDVISDAGGTSDVLQLSGALNKQDIWLSHVANTLRLLQLPEEVLWYVRNGKLTAGHARALVTARPPGQAAPLMLVVRGKPRPAKIARMPFVPHHYHRAAKGGG